MFRTQFPPNFLVAEHWYGLRNTIFWCSKDLAHGETGNMYETTEVASFNIVNIYGCAKGKIH
jgi:hypothetical protein